MMDNAALLLPKCLEFIKHLLKSNHKSALQESIEKRESYRSIDLSINSETKIASELIFLVEN